MKQIYSAVSASVKVRQSKQRTKALISALIGREVGYPEAMKVKRDLVTAGVLPHVDRMLPGEPLREQSLRSKSREAGLAPHVVWNRMDHGWSEEDALSTPVGASPPGGLKRNHPNSLAVKARAAGLPPDMVRRRVRNGMTEEQALATPVVELQRRA